MSISIPAIKVHQWLDEWEKINFNEFDHKKRPKEYFHIISIKASILKALSGIQRREDDRETGIQRKHDQERSNEIREYIRYGYPWSSLTPAKKNDPDFTNMQKPGWIPTAIVINILDEKSMRNKVTVHEDDLIIVNDHSIDIPFAEGEENKWKPSNKLHPIEVIDGQHRLWAFNEKDDLDFEIPVVAFHGLDISWQAYLFWVINIKPKKIDPSLAFDMYPLLRDQDWLEKGEQHIIYRETRAQELVDILYSYPESPWFERIEMLGGTRNYVSQNAWVRSLTTTFIKKWEKTSGRPGGLYGSKMNYDQEDVLNWSRIQQSACLIYIWKNLEEHVKKSKKYWAEEIRRLSGSLPDLDADPAFCGKKYALINSDQGIRAILQTFNDILYLEAQKLKLESWNEIEIDNKFDKFQVIRENIKSLKTQPFALYVDEINGYLSLFDWRTSLALEDDDPLMKTKKSYRGSSGYKELRVDILKHLSKYSSMQEVAEILLKLLSK